MKFEWTPGMILAMAGILIGFIIAALLTALLVYSRKKYRIEKENGERLNISVQNLGELLTDQIIPILNNEDDDTRPLDEPRQGIIGLLRGVVDGFNQIVRQMALNITKKDLEIDNGYITEQVKDNLARITSLNSGKYNLTILRAKNIAEAGANVGLVISEGKGKPFFVPCSDKAYKIYNEQLEKAKTKNRKSTYKHILKVGPSQYGKTTTYEAYLESIPEGEKVISMRMSADNFRTSFGQHSNYSGTMNRVMQDHINHILTLIYQARQNGNNDQIHLEFLWDEIEDKERPGVAGATFIRHQILKDICDFMEHIAKDNSDLNIHITNVFIANNPENFAKRPVTFGKKQGTTLFDTFVNRCGQPCPYERPEDMNDLKRVIYMMLSKQHITKEDYKNNKNGIRNQVEQFLSSNEEAKKLIEDLIKDLKQEFRAKEDIIKQKFEELFKSFLQKKKVLKRDTEGEPERLFKRGLFVGGNRKSVLGEVFCNVSNLAQFLINGAKYQHQGNVIALGNMNDINDIYDPNYQNLQDPKTSNLVVDYFFHPEGIKFLERYVQALADEICYEWTTPHTNANRLHLMEAEFRKSLMDVFTEEYKCTMKTLENKMSSMQNLYCIDESLYNQPSIGLEATTMYDGQLQRTTS